MACCSPAQPLAFEVFEAGGTARPEGVGGRHTMDKPKIRAVEAFPVEQQGQTFVLLRDPTGIAPEPILIGMGAYFLVAQMDGKNERLDLQAAFARRFGEIIPSEQIQQLIDALDRAYFLESARYLERVREVTEEFAKSPQRPAALAGLAYHADPIQLREEIAAFFRRPGAPGEIPVPSTELACLSGLISPHIDPRRGGAAYAHAYGELLRRERPELVVILGTSHYVAAPNYLPRRARTSPRLSGWCRPIVNSSSGSRRATRREPCSNRNCCTATNIRLNFRRCSWPGPWVPLAIKSCRSWLVPFTRWCKAVKRPPTTPAWVVFSKLCAANSRRTPGAHLSSQESTSPMWGGNSATRLARTKRLPNGLSGKTWH